MLPILKPRGDYIVSVRQSRRSRLKRAGHPKTEYQVESVKKRKELQMTGEGLFNLFLYFWVNVYRLIKYAIVGTAQAKAAKKDRWNG